MPKYYKEIVGKRQMYRRINKERDLVLSEINLAKQCPLETNNTSDGVIINESENIILQPLVNIVDHQNDLSEQLNNFLIKYKPQSNNDQSDFCDNDDRFLNVEDVHIMDQKHNNIRPDIKLIIKNWALKNKVSHTALSDLLHKLAPLHPELPLYASTLFELPLKPFLKF